MRDLEGQLATNLASMVHPLEGGRDDDPPLLERTPLWEARELPDTYPFAL